MDWTLIFETLHKVKMEIKENFPYRYLAVDNAEADDIIAILTKESKEPEIKKVLILSGDKDFIQLQMNDNVFQYSPATKKFLNGVDPQEYLKEHILRGDKGDGIPNVLSSDNVIVDKIRQTPITKKNLEVWMNGSLPKEHSHRFERNQELIDLRHTPNHLMSEIIEQYEEEPIGNRNKLPAYFTENKLEVLSNHIGDF